MSAFIKPKAPRADCVNCPCKHSAIVSVKTNKNAKMIVLGEAPGRMEEERGEFFVGPSGRLVDSGCSRFGINRDRDLHVTNTLLCRPSRALTPKEWRQATVCCRQRLFLELRSVRSTYILALGAKALYTTTGKQKIFPWIGAEATGVAFARKTKRTRKEYTPGELADFSTYTIFPTLHPAYILRGNEAYRPVVYRHIGRAWGLATDTLLKWEWPEEHIHVGPEMIAALTRLLVAKRLGFDIETMGVDPLTSRIMCIGFGSKALNLAVSVPWRSYKSKGEQVKGLDAYEEGAAVRHLCVQILTDHTIKKVMQNGQHDYLGVLAQEGIDIKGYEHDTLLSHAVLAPRLRHDLGFIACCESYSPRWKSEFKVETDAKGLEAFTQRPEEELRIYNGRDAFMTDYAHDSLFQELERGRPEVLVEYHSRIRLMQIGAKMTQYGIKVDQEAAREHLTYCQDKRDHAITILNQVAGEEINPNANKQLHKLFFGRFEVQAKAYTDKGAPKLDKEILKGLVAYPDERVETAARALLEYRRWNKLLSTYVEPLSKLEVAHPTWRVWGTRTGRWSASIGEKGGSPQTIPKPVEGTPGMRNMFVAREGRHIIKVDYSQLELRIMALLSGDKLLLEGYQKGEDVHQTNVDLIFGRAADPKQNERQRTLAKSFAYAANYGADVLTIWKALVVNFPDLTLSQVHKIHDMWFRLHPTIKSWQEQHVAQCRKQGFVEAPLSGRRQYYPGNKVDANECLNFPFQGTGADIIDQAIKDLAVQLNWKNEGILLQVHDEINCEGDPTRLIPIMRKCMERTITLEGRTMFFPVDIEVGDNWANCTEEEAKRYA